MDIGGNSKGLAKRLSNFKFRPFVFDGVECNSMEGLLQSFKYKDFNQQIQICKLTGIYAKRKGQKRNKAWKRTQTLYWNNVAYKRNSIEYQNLLDRAYEALFTNIDFKTDLKLSGNSTLTHSIGKSKKSETVLTEQEFCSRLIKLRNKI